eukprot:gnl/MRDRNA2_/MRDRNA2_106481_c0_seq1.p1 gnl/MRDRNA2_/MRDRNA2_106481_c0~~gnl/MRDRNA2_/MRDRNA2_106481_c0_seq1.p1  ORF type:complete len:291 (-),score=41.93 gnl/MRDRNA2_/MRDRNA2_106481_c0_seq1:228-1100(-)
MPSHQFFEAISPMEQNLTVPSRSDLLDGMRSSISGRLSPIPGHNSQSPPPSRPVSRMMDREISVENRDNAKICFDTFTLRRWFMEMDINGNGFVGKAEFIPFLRSRPELKKLMLSHSAPKHPTGNTRTSDREAAALEIRRILKFLKELDYDGNGSIDWEEFVEFFKKCGYLLEYSSEKNPRAKMANLMSQINDQQVRGDEVDEKLMNEFHHLTHHHLPQSVRRWSKEFVGTPSNEPQQLPRRASDSQVPLATNSADEINPPSKTQPVVPHRRMSAPVRAAATASLQPLSR